MADDRLVTEIVVDASQALAAVQAFIRAADQIVSASQQAATRVDQLGASFDKTALSAAKAADAMANAGRAGDASTRSFVQQIREQEDALARLTSRHNDVQAAVERLRTGQASLATVMKDSPLLFGGTRERPESTYTASEERPRERVPAGRREITMEEARGLSASTAETAAISAVSVAPIVTAVMNDVSQAGKYQRQIRGLAAGTIMAEISDPSLMQTHQRSHQVAEASVTGTPGLVPPVAAAAGADALRAPLGELTAAIDRMRPAAITNAESQTAQAVETKAAQAVPVAAAAATKIEEDQRPASAVAFADLLARYNNNLPKAAQAFAEQTMPAEAVVAAPAVGQLTAQEATTKAADCHCEMLAAREIVAAIGRLQGALVSRAAGAAPGVAAPAIAAPGAAVAGVEAARAAEEGGQLALPLTIPFVGEQLALPFRNLPEMPGRDVEAEARQAAENAARSDAARAADTAARSRFDVFREQQLNSLYSGSARAAPKAVDAHDSAAARDLGAAAKEGAAGIEELGKAAEKTHGFAQRLREGFVIFRELLRGDWSRIIGSASIELNNFGLLEAVFNRYTIAATAAAGAVALIGLRAKSVQDELRNFGVITQALGTGTPQGFHAQVEALRDTGSAAADAQKSVQELARAPEIAPEFQRSIQTLGRDLAAVMDGQPAEWVGKLVTAFRSGEEPTAKLALELHAVTAEETAQMRVMAEHGDLIGAQRIAIEGLTRTYGGAFGRSLSDGRNAVVQLGAAWRGFLDSLADTAGFKAAEAALDSLLRKMSTAEGARTAFGGLAGAGSGAILGATLGAPLLGVGAIPGALLGTAVGAGVGVGIANLPSGTPAQGAVLGAVEGLPPEVAAQVTAQREAEFGGPPAPPPATEHAADRFDAAADKHSAATDKFSGAVDKFATANPAIAPGPIAQPPSATAAEATAQGRGPVPGPEGMQGQMFSWLLTHGYTPTAAAGVIGNAAQESSLNPQAGAEKPTVALGLFQEDAQAGNRQALEAFAGQTHRAATDWQVQMEFMNQQIQKLDPSFRQVTGAAADAATRFMHSIERPGIPQEERRRNFAEQALVGEQAAVARVNEQRQQVGLAALPPEQAVTRTPASQPDLDLIRKSTEEYKREAEAAAQVGIAREALQAQQRAEQQFRAQGQGGQAAEIAGIEARNAVLARAAAEYQAQHSLEQQQINDSFALARAYSDNEIAARQLVAQQQSQRDVILHNVDATTRYHEILDKSAADAVRAGYEQLAASAVTVAGQEKIAEAALRGRDAERQARAEVEADIQAHDKLVAAQAAVAAYQSRGQAVPAGVSQAFQDAVELRDKIAQQRLEVDRAAQTQDVAHDINRNRDQAAALQLELSLQGQNTREIANQVELAKEYLAVRERDPGASDAAVRGYLESLAAVQHIRDALIEAQQHQKALADGFRAIATEVEQGLTQAIRTALSRSPAEAAQAMRHHWDELRQHIRQSAADMVSTLANSLFIKPTLATGAQALGLGQEAQQLGGGFFGGAATHPTNIDEIIAAVEAARPHGEIGQSQQAIYGAAEASAGSLDKLKGSAEGASAALDAIKGQSSGNTGALPTYGTTLAENFPVPGATEPARQPETGVSTVQSTISLLPGVPGLPGMPGTGLPGFAFGTDRTPPGMILVGERGPELIAQSGGLAVIPADKTREILISRETAGAVGKSEPGQFNFPTATAEHFATREHLANTPHEVRGVTASASPPPMSAHAPGSPLPGERADGEADPILVTRLGPLDTLKNTVPPALSSSPDMAITAGTSPAGGAVYRAAYAEGTDATAPGTVLVGEGGAELVGRPDTLTIAPELQQTTALLGGVQTVGKLPERAPFTEALGRALSADVDLGPRSAVVEPAIEAGKIGSGPESPVETAIRSGIELAGAKDIVRAGMAAREAVSSFQSGNIESAAGSAVGATLAGGMALGGIVSPEGKVAETAGAIERAGIRAFHASPHDFERFDISKVGTGQGAQSFGHGIYAAESPAVSGGGGQYDLEFTAKNLDKRDLNQGEASVLRMLRKGASDLDIIGDLAANGYTFDEAVSTLKSVSAAKAKIYEVNIAARPEQFLDWDRPLSEQHQAVVDKIADLYAAHGIEGGDVSGARAYGDLSRIPGPPRQFDVSQEAIDRLTTEGMPPPPPVPIGPSGASTMLREVGIPGVKYLDRGSRATGEGTHNYVVFDDSLITILRKYGLAGLTGGAGTVAAASATQQQAVPGFAEGTQSTPPGTIRVGEEGPEILAAQEIAPELQQTTALLSPIPRHDPLKLGAGQDTAVETALHAGISLAGGFDIAHAIESGHQAVTALQRGDVTTGVGAAGMAALSGAMVLGGIVAPESKAAEAVGATAERTGVTTYRGQIGAAIEGVESARYPGLRFSSESPAVASIYAEGEGGNVERLHLKPQNVLDLSASPSVEGSGAVRDVIAKGLGQSLRWDSEIAPALRFAGYDAVKLNEHVLGRHGPSATWVEVLPESEPVAAATASEPAGIRAFHGSPHDFERFDISKIGTGEGAQAYGHGLYFAEAEGTARSYRLMSAPVYQGPLAAQVANKAYEDAIAGGLTGDEAAKAAIEWLNYQGKRGGAQTPQTYYDAANNFDVLVGRRPGLAGHMYEVNIAAQPEQFLDFNKSLSGQSSHVQKALGFEGVVGAPSNDEAVAAIRAARDAGIPLKEYPPYVALQEQLRQATATTYESIGLQNVPGISPGDLTGSAYHTGLIEQHGDPVAAAKYLQDRGVAGIRYFDQGSRSGGEEPTRNYVVFDDSLITILRKYGLAGTVVGGGAALGAGQARAEEAAPPPQTIPVTGAAALAAQMPQPEANAPPDRTLQAAPPGPAQSGGFFSFLGLPHVPAPQTGGAVENYNKAAPDRAYDSQPIIAVPALATGGTVQSTGLALIHAGEEVVPATVAAGGSALEEAISALRTAIDGLGDIFRPVGPALADNTNLLRAMLERQDQRSAERGEDTGVAAQPRSTEGVNVLTIGSQAGGSAPTIQADRVDVNAQGNTLTGQPGSAMALGAAVSGSGLANVTASGNPVEQAGGAPTGAGTGLAAAVATAAAPLTAATAGGTTQATVIPGTSGAAGTPGQPVSVRIEQTPQQIAAQGLQATGQLVSQGIGADLQASTGKPATPQQSIQSLLQTGGTLASLVNTLSNAGSAQGLLPSWLTGGGGSSEGGLFGGVTNIFNNIGGSLGFASPSIGVDVTGGLTGAGAEVPVTTTAAEGGLFGTTTLGAALQGAGAGFGVGSLLNSLLGGNQLGGTAGSAVGGIAGSIIGSIIPGIGTLLGGLLGGGGGGILGGIFGPGPPGQSAGANIGPGGQLSFGTAGANAQNIQGVQGAAGQLSQFEQALGQLTNAAGQPIGQIPGGALVVTQDNRQGIRVLSTIPGVGGTYGQDAANAVEQTELAIVHGLQNVQGVLSQVLKNVTDPAQLQAAVQFANVYQQLQHAADGAFKSIQSGTTTLGPFQQALEQINSTFAGLTSQAQTFGLSTAPIQAAQNYAYQQLGQDFQQSLDAAFGAAAFGSQDFITSLKNVGQAYAQNVNDLTYLAANLPGGIPAQQQSQQLNEIAAVAAAQAGPTLAGLSAGQLETVASDLSGISPIISGMAETLVQSGKELPSQLTQITESVLSPGILDIQKAIATGYEQTVTAAQAGLPSDQAQAAVQAEQAQVVAQATGTVVPLGPIPDWVTQLTEAIVNPLQLAVQKAQAAGDQQVQIAEETGANVTKVQQATATQVEQIWYNATQQLRDLTNQITSGSLSGLTAANQVGASIQYFNQILALVQGGNTNFMDQLASAGQAAIQAAQQAYGNGPVAAQVREQVLAAVQPLLGAIPGTTGAATVVPSIAGATGATTPTPATTGTSAPTASSSGTTAAVSTVAASPSSFTGVLSQSIVSQAQQGSSAAIQAILSTLQESSVGSLGAPGVSGQGGTAAPASAGGITAVSPVYPNYPSAAQLTTALNKANTGTASGQDYTYILEAVHAGILNPATNPQFTQAITAAEQYASGQSAGIQGGQPSPLMSALTRAQQGQAVQSDWLLINEAVNAGIINPATMPQYAQVIQGAREIANAQAESLASAPDLVAAYQALIQGLPHFAAGTAATPPGWILVGEQGPEWMYQQGGATVLPYGHYPPANDNQFALVQTMPGAAASASLPPGISVADIPMRSFAGGTSSYPSTALPAMAPPQEPRSSAFDTAVLLAEVRELRNAVVNQGTATRKQIQGGQVQAMRDAQVSNAHLSDINKKTNPALPTPPRRAVG